MSRFQTGHPDIHWEDTGQIKVYNYPQKHRNGAPYVVRIYREFDRHRIEMHPVYKEGEAIYFNDLTAEQKALAACIGEAQAVLSKTLPREQFLKLI